MFTSNRESLEEDYPDKIGQNYTCSRRDLGDVMKEELGPELYEKLLLKLRNDLGFQEKTSEIKNPIFIYALIDNARQSGKTFVSMEIIVNMILEKRHGPPVASAPIHSP